MTTFPLQILLVDVRSTANVGSILRTADATSVEAIYFSGYTPYPKLTSDKRPPHVVRANTKAIAKTALGAEMTQALHYEADPLNIIANRRRLGYQILAIEQSPRSVPLPSFQLHQPALLLFGNEVTGIDESLMTMADAILEIPMAGHKESYGVAVAAGIALYALRFSQNDPPRLK